MTSAETISKKVLFSMGGKGGVGKTAVMSGIAEYLNHQRVPVQMIDCDTENKSNCAYFAPEWPNECQRSRKYNRQESGHNFVCIAERSVKPYGAECPGGGNDDCEEDEQLANPANNTHQILHYWRLECCGSR